LAEETNWHAKFGGRQEFAGEIFARQESAREIFARQELAREIWRQIEIGTPKFCTRQELARQIWQTPGSLVCEISRLIQVCSQTSKFRKIQGLACQILQTARQILQ
jgi:hypothetical protein